MVLVNQSSKKSMIQSYEKNIFNKEWDMCVLVLLLIADNTHSHCKLWINIFKVHNSNFKKHRKPNVVLDWPKYLLPGKLDKINFPP